MAAMKGRDFVVKRGNGASPATFTSLGCFKTNTFTIAGSPVEITCSDDAENATTSLKRKLLANAGVVGVDITATGTFNDNAVMFLAETDAMNQSLNEYQVVFGNGDIYQGLFMISSLEYTGDFDGAQQYSLSLVSSGKTTVSRY